MSDFDFGTSSSDDVLVSAFELPDTFPENFRELHAEIIERLRNEARSVSMGTIQRLLIAGIAYNFVQLKILESMGESGGRSYIVVRDSWLKMTAEFNKLLVASESKSRTTLLVEVENVLRNSLKKIKDPALKRELASEWSEEFARIDV